MVYSNMSYESLNDGEIYTSTGPSLLNEHWREPLRMGVDWPTETPKLSEIVGSVLVDVQYINRCSENRNRNTWSQ